MISAKRRKQMTKAAKRYDKKHPHRRKEIAKKWRDNHPVEQAQALWNAKLKRLGINQSIYDAMMDKQDSLCAICRKVLERPAIDHNHDTGKVRELLCMSCNAGIGMFYEDISVIRSAIEYLERHSGDSDI